MTESCHLRSSGIICPVACAIDGQERRAAGERGRHAAQAAGAFASQVARHAPEPEIAATFETMSWFRSLELACLPASNVLMGEAFQTGRRSLGNSSNLRKASSGRFRRRPVALSHIRYCDRSDGSCRRTFALEPKRQARQKMFGLWPRLDYADLKGSVRQASAKRTLRKNPQNESSVEQLAVGSCRRILSQASREGCRMSKRRILKLVETNGRGRSGLALPESPFISGKRWRRQCP